MKRAAIYIAGGSLVVALAATFAPTSDGKLFSARSETFDARWVALDVGVKQDRLTAPRKVQTQTVSIVDDARQTTILSKTDATPETKSSQTQPESGRDVSRGVARKEKVPVGCDPSFSPVAMPQMAHVTGRCLVERETGTKFAELVR